MQSLYHRPFGFMSDCDIFYQRKEDNMEIGELMDLEMYGSMYLLFAMAFFYVEGANLLVPSRVNFNFKRILSPFASFFKGFIGAGGWNHYASVILGRNDFVQLNDGASVSGCPVSAAV